MTMTPARLREIEISYAVSQGPPHSCLHYIPTLIAEVRWSLAEVDRIRSFLSKGDQDRYDSERAWTRRAEAAEQELARYKAVYTAAEALNFTEFAKDGRYTIDANPEALDALGVALAAGKDTDDG